MAIYPDRLRVGTQLARQPGRSNFIYRNVRDKVLSAFIALSRMPLGQHFLRLVESFSNSSIPQLQEISENAGLNSNMQTSCPLGS